MSNNFTTNCGCITNYDKSISKDSSFVNLVFSICHDTSKQCFNSLLSHLRGVLLPDTEPKELLKHRLQKLLCNCDQETKVLTDQELIEQERLNEPYYHTCHDRKYYGEGHIERVMV